MQTHYASLTFLVVCEQGRIAVGLHMRVLHLILGAGTFISIPILEVGRLRFRNVSSLTGSLIGGKRQGQGPTEAV